MNVASLIYWQEVYAPRSPSLRIGTKFQTHSIESISVGRRKEGENPMLVTVSVRIPVEKTRHENKASHRSEVDVVIVELRLEADEARALMDGLRTQIEKGET